MQEIKTLGQLKGAERIKNLPIYSHLEEICQTLKSSPSRFLVLTAETGAGKSTAVPLALLEQFPKKILMLEPRRLAAVNVASRVAELLGEQLGQTAGYKVFLENKSSPATRLEVMTEAILTRRLQADPSLEDASVVVLDEFHERSINADLALAFLKEAMQLRDDLFVIIMSATIDARRIARFCGTVDNTKTASETDNDSARERGSGSLPCHNDAERQNAAPILEISGRTFPVQFFYKPELSVAAAVRWALSGLATNAVGKTITPGATNPGLATGTASTPKTAGRSILVFLPGIYEINKTFSELSGLSPDAAQSDVQIERLHSSVSFEEQKKILSPAAPGTTRVILSSSIAETSLTIPDVVCVIDCGLSRQSQMNNNVGATHLVTIPESEFSAAQRAGRAGRTQEGICVRLWSQNEPRTKNSLPEILRSDLSELLLECAEWGSQDPAALEWLDPPAPASWATARELLQQLACLDKDGQITQLGRAALRLGIGPRLGCAAIYGGAAFVLPYSQYKDSSPALQKKFVLNLERRLEEAGAQIGDEKFLQAKEGGRLLGLQKSAGLQDVPDPLLAGFPDRIARCTADAGVYQFPSGRIAALKDYKGGLGPEWIVAVEADAGSSQGAIYSYKALDSVQTEKWILSRAQKNVVCDFENGKVVKTEFIQYGKIILSQKILKAEDADIKSVLCFSVQKNGFDSLPLDERTKSFLVKRKFYEQNIGANGSGDTDSFNRANNSSITNVPKKFDKAWLSQNAAEWLLPFLTGNKITAQNVYDALYYFYDGAAVEKNVPSKLELQTGRSVKVVYVDGETVVPTIEIIIQQIFGCFETPKVMGVPALLKLLSPARRPLQITSDLENFWQNTWPEICKEMKGRYPKHNWDYRVAEKE